MSNSFSHASRGLLGLLDDINETPPLGCRQRTGLGDDDKVTDSGGVELVMSLHLGCAAQNLAVEGVLDPVFDLHDDRLLHLVAHNVAATSLAVATGRLSRLSLIGNRGLRLGVFSHDQASFFFLVAASAPAVSAFTAASAVALFGFSVFTTSATTGVARIPSSRSRMMV